MCPEIEKNRKRGIVNEIINRNGVGLSQV